MTQKAEIDQLNVLIGEENSVRGHLADVDCEIEKLQAALAPMLSKQLELLGKLSAIDNAKKSLVALKRPAANDASA